MLALASVPTSRPGCRRRSLQALAVPHHAGVQVTLRDERQGGTSLDVRFEGELQADQRRAAEAMLKHDTGVLAATTAFGKTVIAAWLIARRGVNGSCWSTVGN